VEDVVDSGEVGGKMTKGGASEGGAVEPTLLDLALVLSAMMSLVSGTTTSTGSSSDSELSQEKPSRTGSTMDLRAILTKRCRFESGETWKGRG
jgi:hypothetical protein